MKKLLLTSLLTFAIIFISAQEQNMKTDLKGKWMIGGAIGYDHDKTGATNVTNDNFRIMPSIWYFYTSDMSVGASLGYEYDQTKLPSTGRDIKTKKNTLVFMPMARKYWQTGEKVFLFAQLDVPFKFGDSKTGNGAKDNYIEWGANLRPGIDIFLTPKWSVETTIGRFGYGIFNPDGKKHNDDSAFGINLNDINLGVKYIF